MISIEAQALAYAEFMREKGLKTIALYPRKKSVSSHSNMARMYVFGSLSNEGSSCFYGETERERLERVEVGADREGYRYTEVDLADYPR